MKPKFVTDLEVELVNDKKNSWRLTAPLQYQSHIMDAVITVPKGFKTDFASVPRVGILYALFGNTARKAATVHDYLYSDPHVGQHDADEVFLEAMKASDIPVWQRYPMHWAVSIFGWMFKRRT